MYFLSKVTNSERQSIFFSVDAKQMNIQPYFHYAKHDHKKLYTLQTYKYSSKSHPPAFQCNVLLNAAEQEGSNSSDRHCLKVRESGAVGRHDKGNVTDAFPRTTAH